MDQNERLYGSRAEKSAQEVNAFLNDLTAWTGVDLLKPSDPSSKGFSQPPASFASSESMEGSRFNGEGDQAHHTTGDSPEYGLIDRPAPLKKSDSGKPLGKSHIPQLVRSNKGKSSLENASKQRASGKSPVKIESVPEIKPSQPPDSNQRGNHPKSPHTVTIEKCQGKTTNGPRTALAQSKSPPGTVPPLKASQENVVLDEDPLLNFDEMRRITAQEQKELGNEAFKAKDYVNAIGCYTKAIQNVPEDPILYANRAQACLNMGLNKKAVADCDIALRLKPNFVKALFRRGKARMQGGDLENGKRDFDAVLELEPNNKEVFAALEETHRKMKVKEALRKKQHKDDPPPYSECGERARAEMYQQMLLDSAYCKMQDDRRRLKLSEQGEDAEKKTVPSLQFPRTILPIIKPPELQSKRPLLNIRVKVVGDDAKSSGIGEKLEVPKLKNQGGVPKIPDDSIGTNEFSKLDIFNIPPKPKTTVQFYLDWNALTMYPYRAALYLKEMTSEDFEIFREASIDYKILSQLIDVLVWEFLPHKWDYKELLDGLTRIGRLGTLILLFTEQDKAGLRKLVSQCVDCEIREKYSSFGL